MDKYKKTSGLNYLSENSYKGDGSPGMVMGIASDARGDTNTNEAQKPTTNSKHSSERDLKKYDPAHGHTKPEGGNPQVCHLCKGEGCEPCGHTGEEITKVRNDPKVDETKHSELDDIKRLSGLTEAFAWDKLEEDILSDRKIWLGTSLEKDAKEKLKTVSKEDIAMAKAIDPEISGSPFPDMSILDIINKRVMLITKKWNDSLLSKNYPMGTTKEDIEQAVYNQIGNYLESGILDEIEDGYSDINAYRGPAYVEWKQSLGPNADELIKQAVSMSTNRHTNWHVGSNLDTDALYTKDEYELIDPNLGSGKAEKFGMWADDELNEIAKLSGLEEAKRKKRPDLDDLEDEEEKPEDPDSDKVQHILMQLRKAKDVDGDHPIKFLDGTKIKLPVADIDLFMDKYMDMKPLDREKMQQVAVMSKEQFDTILSFFQPKHGKLEKSIYEDEEII